MDFLIRKVMTETEYAALKSTLKPTDGVVVVSDVDPKVVVTFAIGSTSFTPAGGSYAPDTATFLTTSDETATMPNSVNLGALSTPNGATAILLNKPVEFGVATPDVLDLTDDNPALLFIANNGTPQQSRYLDFLSSSGKTALTFTGVDGLLIDAESIDITSFLDTEFNARNLTINCAGVGNGVFVVNALAIALNGNTVGSDTGFDGPVMACNFMESNTTELLFRRRNVGTAFTVATDTNVTVDFRGPMFANLGSSTGTDVVVSGNQFFQKTSSRRFKENIEPLKITDELLTNLLKLEPVTYTYKNGSDSKDEEEASRPKRKSIGLVAEAVNELFPELVNLDDEGLPFSINYDGVGVLLINAIKQLQRENGELLERIEALENQLKA
jgi:hypothetical protein